MASRTHLPLSLPPSHAAPEFTPLYALLNEYTREVHALRALPSGVRLSLASPVGTSPRMYSPEEGRPRREGSTAATPTPARSSPRGDGISAASSVQGSPAAQGLAGGSRLATTQTEEEEDAAYQTVTGSVQQKRPRLDGLFDF